MRVPTPRFGLLTLMIVVALAAVALGFWRRAEGLRREADEHEEKAAGYASDSFHLTHNKQPVSASSAALSDRCMARDQYHRAMAERCRRVTWRPWLALQAAPPLPADPFPEAGGAQGAP